MDSEEGDAPGAGAEIHLQPAEELTPQQRDGQRRLIPREACIGLAPVAPWKGAHTVQVCWQDL